MIIVNRIVAITVLLITVAVGNIHAHCQVPCGIYDDQMRIQMMEEHVTTIEKSMNQITKGQNSNQSVRWVLNKEKHADELAELVTYYFMAQRIKPGMDKYNEKLATLHEILVYAMKAKQTTDLAHVKKLRELIHNFEHDYFGKAHKH